MRDSTLRENSRCSLICSFDLIMAKIRFFVKWRLFFTLLNYPSFHFSARCEGIARAINQMRGNIKILILYRYPIEQAVARQYKGRENIPT